ncbi:hypothetical protein DS745_03025 [Anaerobacillus alkaliphilus]|uniref:DUF7674 domain-containing protein n=1 Tax=Anaerobacillus alkaliphilus TaxID=1548597 RepID=A0A4Q0VY82_9BACI|nr:hypothetical protein [Anaerobacillus alkaliphilus]RXJ04372.1 hypothetical protein DS745_03025 [Anaerobacillus alkaliphilus]
MNREKLTEYFLKNFPEYEATLKEHLDDYGELLAHVFYGDTICVKLIELLKDDTDNEEEIKKIFLLLEKMAVEGDIDVKEVLQVSILEVLGDDKDLLEKSYKYMGDKTNIASDEIERFWGRK